MEVNKKARYHQLFATVPLMLNLLKSEPILRSSGSDCWNTMYPCLMLQPEKDRHYQPHVLISNAFRQDLWCGNRIHAAQFHVSIPVYIPVGSCFTYNICSIIRGFLHITSLLQVTWWTCTTNSKGLVTFAWHFFERTSTKGWAVEQKFYPPAKKNRK